MKTLTGKVIANSTDKTIKVLVERLWQHPVYKKRIKRSKKFLVHSNKQIEIGKKVVIGETKPISKNKCWKVMEVLDK